MLIVKRKNYLADWPNLPDGTEVEAVIGVMDNDAEDEIVLLSAIAERINNDPAFKDDPVQGETWVAEVEQPEREGDHPYVVVSNEDGELVWFVIELEPVVLLDHDTIQNTSVNREEA